MKQFSMGLALLLAAAGAQAAAVADWQFQGTLADSLAAPALAPLLTPDGAFVAEAVGADPARTVRTFSAGGGFEVPATGLIADSGYTVAMLVRLDEIGGYRKLFDPSGRSTDLGLYVYFGDLMLYPYEEGATQAFGANRWHQVVMTRSGSGQVRGYIDGDLQFVVADAIGASAIASPPDRLTFLADDCCSEQSAGAVARIRLWNAPLPVGTIANLDDNLGARLFYGDFED